MTVYAEASWTACPWYTESRVKRGASPEELLAGAKSIISLGMSYLPADQPQEAGTGPRGRVAVYAWGDDYHRVLKRRMKALVEDVSAKMGQNPRVALVRRRRAYAGPRRGTKGLATGWFR